MITTLYDPLANSDPLALGFLAYGQLPIPPAYPFPLSLSATDVFFEVPNLLDSATTDTNGVTLNTDGSVFDGILGYDPISFFLAENPEDLGPEDLTGRTLTANANTGYAGFSNYTISGDLDDISLTDLINGDIDELFSLETVNPNFPILDPDVGFTLTFDLAILNESSAANRAGFSLLVVTDDPSREIELGFKTAGNDRIFAQQANFTEGENSSAISLDLSTLTTYELSVSENTYSLVADGVDILSGNLRNYNFNPATSDPPLPEQANPYEIPNLVFFGDNTDQARARFTLGEISISPLQTDSTPTPLPEPSAELLTPLFDYEQYLRFSNSGGTAIVPTVEVDGLPLAQLFDEQFYLAQNLDVAAAVSAGSVPSGFAHFVSSGLAEGRAFSSLYDESLYLASNVDVAAAVSAGSFSSGLEHFLNYGHEEGRIFGNLFNSEDYLTNNPDVSIAIANGTFQSAFEHYIEYGINENRLPLLFLYNEAHYLQNNPDVAIAVAGGTYVDGFEHFVLSGQREGRSPSSLYNEASYLAVNLDVAGGIAADQFASGFEHYAKFGRVEGRQVFA